MPNTLTISISSELQNVFRKQAEQKIAAEKWDGRHTQVKINNFLNCWISEEAFKQLLIQHKAWFRYRGLYFGDAQGAGADFTLRLEEKKEGKEEEKEISLGIRSINELSWKKFSSVPYPNDRFEEEQEKIADFHVVCSNQNGQDNQEIQVNFLGLISKENLLQALEHSEKRYSPANQEYFRTIPLERFSLVNLEKFFDIIEKV
ncbi:hypothetical protein J4437_06745 [Candidatus Woesearchaeota archaeon]|nr:hypothetical protein [Candidatus Woesearchaeota archaeon]